VTDRRRFIAALLAAPLLTTRRGRGAERATSMYLAYTSFAVRMAQGRDLLKTNAAALGADVFRQLCVQFGAAGGQMDLSQVSVGDPAALAAARGAFERDRVALEVSIPSRYLETPEAYATAVTAARALGATRARVALLSGRRYESFETAAAWTAFTTRWRETLLRMRPEFERHRFPIGIENHKDWLAPELARLLRDIDSRFVGACVDFGNNMALLEHPDETIDVLAPFAVTTHLKDMAVRPSDEGFELSEVPLGQGMLPLERYVRVVGRARPEAALCLEMITRDPLRVPYKTDRYWVAFDATRRDPARLKAFEREVLSRAWTRDLPRITGLSPVEQLAREDEHVRASVVYARDVLKLEAS
jgi:sugar phosphate isomerase/epimerase